MSLDIVVENLVDAPQARSDEDCPFIFTI